MDSWIRREESPAVDYPVSFLSKWVENNEKARFSDQFECDATGRKTSSTVLSQATQVFDKYLDWGGLHRRYSIEKGSGDVLHTL